MATLILYGDEKIEDVIKETLDVNNDEVHIIPFHTIDLIIHETGKETKILKSPSVELKI